MSRVAVSPPSRFGAIVDAQGVPTREHMRFVQTIYARVEQLGTSQGLTPLDPGTATLADVIDKVNEIVAILRAMEVTG